MMLTCIGVDSDDDMCRHRLDNIAVPLTCQVIFMVACPCPSFEAYLEVDLSNIVDH